MVIKRLIGQGFVAESEALQDRRSSQLTLTPAGYAVLAAVQPAMNQASLLLAGDLSTAEQHQLGMLLVRLDTFHKPFFHNYRNETLSDLHERALTQTSSQL